MRKCKYCKQPFEPSYNSVQPVCSYSCALKYNREQEAKKEKKQWKEKKKKIQEKLKTLGDYEKEARKWFQKWIRERDQYLPCVSCGTMTSPVWDGGHYLKAELYSGLIFHENNCHRQCRRCNHFLGGNELNYRKGLVVRYGEEYVKGLEEVKDVAREYKYSKSELIEIANKYKNLIKQLKAE